MGTASVVLRDTDDGFVICEVVFGDGFDKSSHAHAGIRRVLDFLDSLGVEVQEPPSGEVPVPTVPALERQH